jgi:hypothetical protein
MNLFHRFVFIPFIMLFTCINFSFSQNIILTTGHSLLSLDTDSGICAVKEIKTFCDPLFLSAALFKDTLYYIGSGNHIYVSVLGDSTFCKTLNVRTSSNALTVDKEGNLYWFEDNTGNLIRFNPHTGEQKDLGHVNYSSAGDLVFSPGSGQGKFGVWLRGSRALRRLEYWCHYDSPASQCSGSSAGSPC